MYLRSGKQAKRPTHQETVECGRHPFCVSSVKWVKYEQGEKIPENAFKICEIESGEEAYACRSDISFNVMVPGFFLKSTQLAYLAYGSTEHIKQCFEIMVVDENSLTWVERQDGVIEQSDHPVIAGMDVGENLYIGKTCTPLRGGRTYRGTALRIPDYVNTEGKSRPGKIHCSHHCLYVPYSTFEYIFPKYLMLVHKPSPAKLSRICAWKILEQLQKFARNNHECINNLPLPQRLKNILKEYKI